MDTLVAALFAAGILVSLGLCGLAYDSYRRWDEPGVGAFAVFVALLGLGGVVGGLASLVLGRQPQFFDVYPWPVPGLIALLLSFLPWGVFGLQYTGRYTRLGWRRTGLLVSPYVLMLALAGVQLGLGVEGTPLDQLVGVVLVIYLFGLVALGAGLLLKTTWEYDHLSLGGGLCLVAGLLLHFVLLDSPTQVSTPEVQAGLYVAAYAVPALAFVAALFRYDTFEATPAVGTIGERTLVGELEDLVVVVDDGDRLIRLNDAAVETLGVSRSDVLGGPLEELLGEGTEPLRERGTVALGAGEGTRRYDVGVSPVADQHGRELGRLLTFHDVTERELREQRLAVLNRVLRHNLRNKLEVVKSHAEVLEERYDDDHAAAVAESVDAVAELGESARTIDGFVSNPAATDRVDLVDAVEETLARVRADRETVTVDLPETAVVVTNRRALVAALESALENALEYTDSTVEVRVESDGSGYAVAVADDGPGIPDGELDSLDAGTETPLQHGTGLGLWQLKWAVTTMGGDLAFDTAEGTTVTFTVPDHEAGATSPV